MHKPYTGVLNKKNMSDIEYKAYKSWFDQRARCNNKNNPGYKWYGAKGIRVLYSSREFIGWWLLEYKKFNGKQATVDRINSSGNYEFGNIRLIDKGENSKKRVLEHGTPISKKRISVYCYKTFQYLYTTDSIKEASDKTGVHHRDIVSICKLLPRRKSGKGYTFRFYNGCW